MGVLLAVTPVIINERPLHLVQKDIIKRNQQMQSRIGTLHQYESSMYFSKNTYFNKLWICSLISEINDEHIITIYRYK